MKNQNADRDMLKEMIYIIEQESKKPPHLQDYDLIKQLTSAVFDATSPTNSTADTQESIEKILSYNAKKAKNIRRNKWIRHAVSICVCIILFIGMNAWTVHVWGMNPFELIYSIVPGGITLHPNDLENQPEILLNTTKDDPYGIREKCEEYNFSPMTPSYIPDDMKLMKLSEHDGTDVKNLSFTYQSKNRTVTLNYEYVINQDMYNNGTIGFPSDEYNIHTETICGKKVIISWEDQIFRAEFCDGQIVYDVFCEKLEYDTAYRILVSYLI